MNRRNLETNLETLSFRHKKGERGGFVRIVATRSDSRFLFHHFCKCAKTSLSASLFIRTEFHALHHVPRGAIAALYKAWQLSHCTCHAIMRAVFFFFFLFFFLETRSRSRGKRLSVLSFILLFLSLCFSPSRYRSCASLMIPIGSGRSPRSIPRVYTRETLELRKFLS